MKKVLLLCFLTLFLHAEDGDFFIGLGYSKSYLNQIEKENYSNIILRGGYSFNDFIGVEGRFNLSSNNKKNDYSLLFKPQYKFDKIGVYSLIGYGVKYGYQNNKFEGSFPLLGLGSEYEISDNFTFYVDYLYFNSDEDLKDFKFNKKDSKDTFSFGVTYQF